MLYEDIALKIPKILVPKPNIDPHKWAVIACDQFTSDPEYWEDVKKIVNNEPSTLNLVFPEVYLNFKNFNKKEYIKQINENMQKYLKDGIFNELEEGLILVKRRTSSNKYRTGLVVAIDLEAYDFSKGSKSLIRATEGTILERIPPRVEIRKDAIIELPHIILLINDKEQNIIEPLLDETQNFNKLYDFELMKNGGHLEGWHITNNKIINKVVNNLKNLKNKLKEKNPDNYLLYAVGDGNHSLATAKTIWEEIKKQNKVEDIKNHPARFALVEIINLYNEGIEFHPIHRVIFNDTLDNIFSLFKNRYDIDVTNINDLNHAYELINHNNKNNIFSFILTANNEIKIITLKNSNNPLVVMDVQETLDAYLKESGKEIDYIHGEKETLDLSKKNNVGIILPNINKDYFFEHIITLGNYPRKTFSIGEAIDKRYYYEARKIKP